MFDEFVISNHSVERIDPSLYLSVYLKKRRKEILYLFDDYKNRDIVIWGTGVFGRAVLKVLRSLRIGNIKAFCSSNVPDSPSYIESYPILSPHKAFYLYPDSIFVIASDFYKEIISQINNNVIQKVDYLNIYNIKNCFVDEFNYTKSVSIQTEKYIKEIDKKLNKTSSVLIFQEQFFNFDGTECFNGGAERYCTDLASVFKTLGLTTYLIQRSNAQKGFNHKIKDLYVFGIPCSDYNDYLYGSYLFSNYKFVVYSGIVFWGENFLHPNILISHGVTWDCPREDNTAFAYYLRFLTGNIDRFVSVDTNTISWLRTTFPDILTSLKAIYIPNYVDINNYQETDSNIFNKKDGRIRILFPRRASPERGYWLVSRILPQLLSLYNFVDFIFLGTVCSQDIQRDLQKFLQVYPNRIFHYAVSPDEMPRYYACSDISIIPTLYSEGTSLSCLEAQACGNVVISSNIGGLTNLVIDGYNGLLINPNEDELLKAICLVIEDSVLRAQLSDNAKKVSAVFDKVFWTNRWKRLVFSVC